MRTAVRKAVIPAAGLGTRCLPLTKAVPKELLPIYDRPALEVIADEALDSGVDTLVLVTGRGKSAIEDHFDRHPFLESRLEGKDELTAAVRKQTRELRTMAVRQGEPLGLGHAVGRAETAVGNEPFAVMLPDDLVFGAGPALLDLVQVYEREGKGVVLLMEVPPEETSRYGIVSGQARSDGTILIDDLVEKPAPADAPTNLAIVGRYVFPPTIFPLIKKTRPGALGEIQLTDAMRALAAQEGLIGVMLSGTRLDTGNPLGILRAALHYACERDPDARALIQDFARSL